MKGDRYMNKTFYKVIMILLSVWLLYEIVHSSLLVTIMVLALIFLFLYKTSPKQSNKRSGYLWWSIGLFLAAFLFTTAFWAILVIFLLVELNSDQKLLETIRDPLFRKEQYWRDKEFISVEWEEKDDKEMRMYRNNWFGDDNLGNDVFEWQDKNYQKIMGDTFYDLGNTILPKKENTLLIRKGFGDTKILIPRDIAVSVDVSVALGKVIIDDEEFDLKNETIKWRSKNYNTVQRKIKIVSSTIIGEVEVVYL